ncbi:MucB/RseB C-terminal domain-containing protein [Sinobacterium norvegicum]|nr:MucB/RseB C-terminal domain-containing protein [Sinobacterium norvegicum]
MSSCSSEDNSGFNAAFSFRNGGIKAVFLAFLTLSLFSVNTQAEQADVPARTMLAEMAEAVRQLDYSGEFTFERNGELEAIRIAHRVVDEVEHERLIFLTGSYREYVRQGHDISCVHPGQQLVAVERSSDAAKFFSNRDFSDFDIEDFYRVMYSGSDRVANREVVKITLEPRDAYRHGYQFYLDKATKIPLKTVLFSSDGQMLERFQYVSIVFNGVTAADVSPSDNSAVILHHHMPEKSASPELAVSMQPQWLPAGFKLAARSIDTVINTGAEVTTFTDGLSTLSLIVEPIPPQNGVPQDLEGKARYGGTVALSRTVFIGEQGFLVTVVGEVPLITAAKVARSVMLQQIKEQ